MLFRDINKETQFWPNFNMNKETLIQNNKILPPTAAYRRLQTTPTHQPSGQHSTQNAFKLLKATYPHMEGQWCSDHVLDLTLEDLAKLGDFPDTISE